MPRNPFTSRRRFLSGALAILAATSMIGVYAAFTESISTQTQNITTASGTGLVLTAGSLQATVNSSVANLVPGDWVTRPVTITNETTYNLSAVSLSVGDSFPGAAFTSASEGLKMTVEEESTPGSGSWSTIYGPATSTGTDLITNIGGGVLTAGSSTSLRITQTFVGPNTSKSLKGAEADLTYTFDGAQRAGVGGTVAADPGLTALNALPGFSNAQYGNGTVSLTDDTSVVEPNDVQIDGSSIPNGFQSSGAWFDQSNNVNPSSSQDYSIQGLTPGTHTISFGTDDGSGNGTDNYSTPITLTIPGTGSPTSFTVSGADSSGHFTLTAATPTDKLIKVSSDYRYSGYYDVAFANTVSPGVYTPHYNAVASSGHTIPFLVETDQGTQTVNVTFP